MTERDDIEAISNPIRSFFVLLVVSLGFLGSIFAWHLLQDVFVEDRLKSLLLERTRGLTREQLFSISYMLMPIRKNTDYFVVPNDIRYMDLTGSHKIDGKAVSFDAIDLCIRNAECRSHFKDHYSKYAAKGYDWHWVYDHGRVDCRPEYSGGSSVQNSIIVQNEGYDFLEVCAAMPR